MNNHHNSGISRHILIFAVATLIVSCLLTSCSNKGKNEQRKNDIIVADSVMEKAYEYYDNAQFDKSIEMCRKALIVYSKHKDSLSMSDTYSHLAASYQRMGMNDSALNNCFAGMRIEEKLKDYKRLSSTYNNLGAVYLGAERPNEAITFIKRAIDTEKSLPDSQPTSLAIRYALASEAYLKLKHTGTAINYINKAFAIDSVAADTTRMARRLAVMGDIYSAMNKPAEAQKRYEQALKLLEISGDKYSMMLTYKSLGSLHEKQGEDAKAIECLETSTKLAEECKAKRVLQQNYAMMADIESNDNPAKAIKHIKMSNILKDSIYNDATSSLAAHYAMEFESQQKQLTIEEQQHDITTQRLIIIAISIAVLLLLLGCVALFIINLLRARAQAAEKNVEQMKESFFTNVTHEFRTPLTVILGETETLRTKDANPANQLRYSAIVNQGNHLLNLVNQLLNISKVRSSIGSVQWKNGDVAILVRMIVENMKLNAETKQVNLDFECGEGDYNIDFVPEYCHSIATNLIANSIKFSNPGGNVKVLINRKKDKAVLTIIDNGCGIKEEDQKHIFELFFQGSAEKADVGTGIGLALVKQMTEAMNGTVELNSIEGKGTTFVISIPVKHNQGGYPKWIPKLLPLPYSEQEHIEEDSTIIDNNNEDNSTDKPIALIVEDNKDVAMFIKHVLDEQYSVTISNNGLEGLKKAREIVPDIIITDLMMPEIDGYELCRKVRSDEIINHIPIIIVTARSEDRDRLKGLSVGADAFLVKPFNNDELVALANNLLHSREMLRLKYQVDMELSLGTHDIEKQTSVETPSAIITEKNNKFMEKLRSIIDKNIANTNINSLFLADKMNLSQRQLNRKVKSVTGIDTANYIREMRVAMAKKLLTTTHDPMGEIAEKCGFDSSSYFSKIFKQYTQFTPTDYRKQFG